MVEESKDWFSARADDVKKVTEKIADNPLGKKALELATEKAKEIAGKAHTKMAEKVGEENANAIESVLDEGVKEATEGKVSLKRKPSPIVTAPRKRTRRKLRRTVFD